MAILLHAAVALDQPHRAQLAEPIERLLDVGRFELHQRRAIALLVAAGADGVEAHGVNVGRGLGLLGQYARHPAVDGAERLPAALRRGGLRLDGGSSMAVLSPGELPES